MSDRNNPLAIAMELATQERKYQDDKAIQSLVSSFNVGLRHFKLNNPPKYYDPLSAYLDGLSGQSGCSLMLGNDTITSMTMEPVKRLIDIAVLQTIAEQLIYALQAHGEEIAY